MCQKSKKSLSPNISREMGELSQWLCYEDRTTNVDMVITVSKTNLHQCYYMKPLVVAALDTDHFCSS